MDLPNHISGLLNKVNDEPIQVILFQIQLRELFVHVIHSHIQVNGFQTHVILFPIHVILFLIQLILFPDQLDLLPDHVCAYQFQFAGKENELIGKEI